MANYSLYTTKRRQQGGALSVILIILLLIVVGVGAAAGAYYWQQHKIAMLNHRISSLNSQVYSLSKQKSTSTPKTSDSSESAQTYTSQKNVKVLIYTPTKNAKLSSPVAVVGKVPGNWSNEAVFPVVLKDSNGTVVAKGSAQVLGDWMTSQPVFFSAKLTYTSTPSGAGTLVLQKDNPSGVAANDDTVIIPIRF